MDYSLEEYIEAIWKETWRHHFCASDFMLWYWISPISFHFLELWRLSNWKARKEADRGSRVQSLDAGRPYSRQSKPTSSSSFFFCRIGYKSVFLISLTWHRKSNWPFIADSVQTEYCPTFLLSVHASVTGVTSHISHIYKGINAMLIIRGPIKPYIFWIKIILAIFLAKTRPDKTIFSALTNLTIDFDFKLSKV